MTRHLAIFVLLFALFGNVRQPLAAAEAAQRQPNVVFILADDKD